MKILMAVHHLPPHYTGGAEWRTLRTAVALQERGYQVRVVSIESIKGDPQAGLTWYDEVYQGVPVRRLTFNLESAPDIFRWKYDNPWVGAHIEALLRLERPDVFHMIGGYLITASALDAAARVGIQSVVSLTDYWWICPRISLLRSDGTLSTVPVQAETCVRCMAEEQRRFRLPGKFLPGLMDLYWKQQHERAKKVGDRLDYLLGALNRTQAILCPSVFLMSMYARMGVRQELMRYVRQGRDFPGLTPEQLVKKASPVLRVGYIGQIAKLKGVHVLIEAIRRLPGVPVKLDIYGDTSAFPKYTAELQRLAGDDARIRLAGTFSFLSETLQDLDVVVVPSMWYENSPNSILEAFAHRTPVITARLGGMAELVQDGKNGLLFAPGDAADLARKIKSLVDAPEILARLQAGIEPVKGIAAEMDELELVYTGLIGQPPNVLNQATHARI